MILDQATIFGFIALGHAHRESSMISQYFMYYDIFKNLRCCTNILLFRNDNEKHPLELLSLPYNINRVPPKRKKCND